MPRHKVVAVGEYVYFLDDPKSPPCLDSRAIVLSVEKGGAIKVNGDTVSSRDFTERMGIIYGARCERALFLTANPDIPYEDVIGIIGELHANIDYLNIGIVTRAEQLKGCAPNIRHWQELRLPDGCSPRQKW